MIRKSLLNFWIENNLNVLLKGKHGVGKTACVLEAFDANGLKWAYYSAATMDPWVDFIGVPKPMKSKKTGKTYLGLVRPKAWVEDEIEALFFDEFSRSSAKIRNAVMELIQFKSINGKKFPKLRFIWAATNPDDDEDNEYNVEPIDPAQLDRFHIHYTVPFLPDKSYFTQKFGKELANSALQWWKELPKELVNLVSPRRLDYALEVYTKGGGVNHVIPQEANPKKLLYCLENGPILEEAKGIALKKDVKKAKAMVKDVNFLDCVQREITNTKDVKFRDFWLSYLPEEYLAINCSKNDAILAYLVQDGKKTDIINSLLKSRDEVLQYKLLCCFLAGNTPSKNPYSLQECVPVTARDMKYYTDPSQVLHLFRKYAKKETVEKQLSILIALAKKQEKTSDEEMAWKRSIIQEILNNYSWLSNRIPAGSVLSPVFHSLYRYVIFAMFTPENNSLFSYSVKNVKFLLSINEFHDAAKKVNPWLKKSFSTSCFSPVSRRGAGRGRYRGNVSP